MFIMEARELSEIMLLEGGHIINLNDGLEGWKTVTHAVRHKALYRTSSAPVSIPVKNKVSLDNTRSGTSTPEKRGTGRIVYEREALLKYRYSPQSMTPPKDLPLILEAIKPLPVQRTRKKRVEKTSSNRSNSSTTSSGSDSAHISKDCKDCEKSS